MEQVPAQMGDVVVRWVKLVIPLVVHSASKVRLRAAATLEMGMPLLLEKQTAVAAVIEPMMSSVSKNNVGSIQISSANLKLNICYI